MSLLVKRKSCNWENYSRLTQKVSTFIYFYTLFPSVPIRIRIWMTWNVKLTYFFRKAARATVNFCWSTSFTETGGILLWNYTFIHLPSLQPRFFFLLWFCIFFRRSLPGRLLPPLLPGARLGRYSDTSLALSLVFFFMPRFLPPNPHFSFLAFLLPFTDLKGYNN